MMISSSLPKQIILILPHLKDNTTSTERFISIIKELHRINVRFKIIEFIYPFKKSVGLGHQKTNDELPKYIVDNIININAQLNFLNRLAFKCLDAYEYPVWKFLNWVHQVVFRNDVFFPGMVDPKLLKVLEGFDNTVVVFGGPFSIFSYAKSLSEKVISKLILDYRDPWTFGYTPVAGNKIIYRINCILNRRREYKILLKASKVITVSHSLKKLLPLSIQSKTVVFENGCNFSASDINLELSDTFDILYAGTLYKCQLKDGTFFEALMLFLEGKDRRKIRLIFAGAGSQAFLIENLANYNLLDIALLTVRLSRDEMIKLFNKSSLFLHLKYGERRFIITSKQSDYLFFNKPILLPVSDKGDLENSISYNKAGFVCNSVKENVEILNLLWYKFLNKQSYFIDNQVFSREYIAGKYVSFITS
ncbi:hypothetical protein [Pedobacter glucosidilyticus]|uniref:hypothetical protein n=1 Tax=Pedobacter glucosidilyticus TaxID=1122941 RepID=UPI00047ED62B|nr:hypothetical protein [Pedobacter glucosidilyticus]